MELGYVAIIADDLTGACDSGIKLLEQGYKTQVVVNSDYSIDPMYEQTTAFSVNTESRNVTAKEAYKRVFASTMKIKKMGVTNFYKKIDSVMRGNVGPEIEAMMDALDIDLAILTPALPANGRRVVDGMLYVQTDEENKNSTTYEAFKQLKRNTSKITGLITLDIQRKGVDALRDEVLKLHQSGVEIILLDCETDEDLEQIAGMIGDLTLPCLPAGSAGLISYLQNYWSKSDEEVIHTGKILVVVGTGHPITSSQLRVLNEREDTVMIGIDVENLIGKDESFMETYLYHLHQETEGISDKKIITITTKEILQSACTGEDLEYNHDLYNEEITSILALATRYVLETFHYGKMILTGGDTASSVMDRIGIERIYLMDEPFPGIVMGRIKRNNQWQLLSTKSGGFGVKDSLSDLVNYMINM